MYAWKSAHVLATLIVGTLVIIAFVLYGMFSKFQRKRKEINRSTNFAPETYMPLNRPLIPMHLYRNREYCVITILAVLGGMIYYSINGESSSLCICGFAANISIKSSIQP